MITMIIMITMLITRRYIYIIIMIMIIIIIVCLTTSCHSGLRFHLLQLLVLVRHRRGDARGTSSNCISEIPQNQKHMKKPWKSHEKSMNWKINELKSPWKSKKARAWLLLSPFDSWRYSRKLRKRVANLSHFNFIYWFYWSTEFPGENAATHPTDVC